MVQSLKFIATFTCFIFAKLWPISTLDLSSGNGCPPWGPNTASRARYVLLFVCLLLAHLALSFYCVRNVPNAPFYDRLVLSIRYTSLHNILAPPLRLASNCAHLWSPKVTWSFGPGWQLLPGNYYSTLRDMCARHSNGAGERSFSWLVILVITNNSHLSLLLIILLLVITYYHCRGDRASSCIRATYLIATFSKPTMDNRWQKKHFIFIFHHIFLYCGLLLSSFHLGPIP